MGKRITSAEYIKRAIEKHGNRYDYSKTMYLSANEKVIIKCKKHGEFTMRARKHTDGSEGCPKCDDGKKSGFSYNSKWAKEPKFIYLLEMRKETEQFVKIGVTKEKLVDQRINKVKTPYRYQEQFVKWRDDANQIEREVKKMFKENK